MFLKRKFMLLEGEPGGAGGGGAGSGSSALTDGGGASGTSGGAPAGNAAGGAGGGEPAGAGGNAGAAPGGAASDWRSALPEGIRADATLGKYKSIEELANAHINAQKFIGSDKVGVPKDSWGDKEWADFRAKIGVPKELEKYEVKFKPEAKVNDDFAKAYRMAAHSAGVLPKDAQKLADWFTTFSAAEDAKAIEAEKAQIKAGLEGLDKEWGEAKKLKWAQAGKVLKELGDEKLSQALIRTGAGNDPEIIKFFAKIGETLWKEDVVVGGPSSPTGLTPSEAKAQYTQIMGDHSHPYWVKEHPGHKDAVAKVQQLIQAQNVKS